MARTGEADAVRTPVRVALPCERSEWMLVPEAECFPSRFFQGPEGRVADASGNVSFGWSSEVPQLGGPHCACSLEIDTHAGRSVRRDCRRSSRNV